MVIEQILDIFKFEPKKKYGEELEDTDESDATSISDISENEDGEDNDGGGDEVGEDEYENPTVNEASVASFETSITEIFLESIDNVGPITNPTISSSTSLNSVLTTVTSVRSSATSLQSNEKDQATCDLCQKKFTARGINIHRNACLKKQQK